MASILPTPRLALPRERLFGEPQLHTDGELSSLAYALDGTLWSVEDPGILRHWNTADGEQMDWRALSDMETLWTFSGDARFLASGSDDLAIWDVSSGRMLTALPQESWVTAVVFGPESEVLVSGHDDGTIRCWDASGQEQRHQFRRHAMSISALAVSRDGRQLAAASEDRVISLWDLETGKHVGDLEGHTDRIPALTWHPDGLHLVSAGWDTTARIWNVRTQQPILLLNNHAAQVTAAIFDPAGTLLATADSDRTTFVWDFSTRTVRYRLTGPETEIRGLAFHPAGTQLAAASEQMIHLWDTGSGQPQTGTRRRHTTRTTVALAPDGSYLASNGGGGTVRLWSLTDPHAEERCLPEGRTVHDLRFSPDGKVLAGAATDHVRLWNLSGSGTAGDLCDLIGAEEEPATGVAFSPDGKILASASAEGTGVWLWRVADGEPILLIPDALEGCLLKSLAFHPEGRLLAVGGIDWLATGGSDGAVALWDLQDRCEVATFPGGCTALAFHPSGNRLACATPDHAILLYDVAGRTLLADCLGHEDEITCLAYAPDGKVLASGSRDRTVRLWNDAGEELVVGELDSQIEGMAFSPDGEFLYTANANTTCSRIRLKDFRVG